MSINEIILQNEMVIRLGFFFGVFAIMAIWEVVAPRRVLTVSKAVRWANNLGLVFLNSFILRLIFPAAAVGMAAFASNQGWGIFNYYEVPPLLAVIASVVIMDFVIYMQHVMVHAVPVLWRLHRVHHADLDFDVTTGARFHTLEIILSMLIKFATIAVLGPPIVAVVIFEVVLNATAMFNHSNVRLPIGLDRVLRWIVVTPDMHRVHHSVEDDEANSNFGFNLPWWDRLFGTYRDQPRAGHENMRIGIHTYRDPKVVSWLHGMLWLPFVGKISSYAINRRQWSDGDEQ
ncbi:MAG: sterol desaturase family protein [Arenicellales bacterium]|jgi:sterol desaturase/sphingolipid hydroxylase (fatty acid hydroxylase superfamily)|nr:sterol desaturase family protein [Arenicellales bacterium]|tara:strand:+ start:11271 stop:12134 length:864 start_codon:yes stop_codon:yes gene_type:complete